ncbi:WD40-repeat-containing domain protein [Trichophaea hybrida]|nr:WD40-repeat-containing domain protein [Trichophaea hybrida]
MKDGSIRKPARPFQFLPSSEPLILDEDEGVGSDDSPPATSATSANAKKHAIEDGVNGVSKKRRRKTNNGVDGDVVMVDAVLSPALTEELPTTNGCDVGTQIEDAVEILAADTLTLTEGEGIVFCAWNPIFPTLLASGGSVARIWSVPEDETPPGVLNHKMLPHEPSRMSTDKPNVIVIRWSPEGDRLASGSYDGQTRIWSRDGRLVHNMRLHPYPVSALKWNRITSILLALSCDGKMIAWDTETGDQHRVFELANGAMVSDVEWVSNSQFIACGENGIIYQFDIGVEGPLHSHMVHDGEVECLAWDEQTETIATGGQDASIWIWHKPSKDSTPAVKLIGHTGGIVSVAWQPGFDFDPASPKRILASASHDTTVRLWDVVSQTCLRVLTRHADPIERICFSSDGNKLASGANGAVLVWKTNSGALTHVYDRAKSRRQSEHAGSEDFSEINEISWDEGGQRLAIGEAHKVILHITLVTTRQVLMDQQCVIVCINSKSPATA